MHVVRFRISNRRLALLLVDLVLKDDLILVLLHLIDREVLASVSLGVELDLVGDWLLASNHPIVDTFRSMLGSLRHKKLLLRCSFLCNWNVRWWHTFSFSPSLFGILLLFVLFVLKHTLNQLGFAVRIGVLLVFHHALR
jgi:hypothetical protein